MNILGEEKIEFGRKKTIWRKSRGVPENFLWDCFLQPRNPGAGTTRPTLSQRGAQPNTNLNKDFLFWSRKN